jgi:glycosyltransferase involved in cell wall biosynthesis
VTLTVLSVAYPLAPVGPDAIGGAEQVLAQIDRALVETGHRSIVIACEGSEVAGEHVAVPRVSGSLDERAVSEARARHRATIQRVLSRTEVDVVHLHGVDFHRYLPPAGVPVLATLHLPVSWYSADALAPSRPGTWLHCVSASQHADCRRSDALLPPIPNGVAVNVNAPLPAKRGFALMLSRICPEKGVHLAIEAAKRAGMPLLIGGAVYPYPEHRRYFDEEVAPRLDAKRRFLGPVGGARKRRLLAAAQCVVIPSLVAETSSLVAREALAAGTPVVAFRKGALAETVDHGRTGFLVGDALELAEAMRQAAGFDPQTCRDAACARFSLGRMIAAYFAVYERLAATGRRSRFAGAA